MYVSTPAEHGSVYVSREAERPSPAGDAAGPFPMELISVSTETAQQLAWLLLYDCLGDDRRADRLQSPFTDLLIWPLVQRKSWVLTSIDIVAAVESIELLQGWFWMDAGYYIDQNPDLEKDLGFGLDSSGEA